MPNKRGSYQVQRHVVFQPLDDSYRLIPLTQGQNAIVDPDDFEFLNKMNWCAVWNENTKSFYAARGIHEGRTTRTIKMHRVILDCKEGEEGDHKNHNTLDNRHRNLRKCSHAINMRNQKICRDSSSGHKGAIWHKRLEKWQSSIRLNGKLIHLGYFPSKEEAAKAYDVAAKIHFGEFAHLNFPPHENEIVTSAAVPVASA